jgi:outer membrane lipoprotein carrier protein
MRSFPLLLAFLLILPRAYALPASPDSSSVLHLFEARYGAARTLQVNFLERYSQNGKFVRAEAGDAYFLRPGKMRWDYEAPEKNVFVVDGVYTWFYSPSDRTATRVPAKQSEDLRTPLAFLTSHMKLSRLCAKIDLVNGIPGAQPGDFVFRCQLRGDDQKRPGAQPDALGAQGGSANNDSPIHAVFFEVSSEGELPRIVIQREGAVEIEFSFTRWKWNPPLDKSLFQFTPPRGVAIVNGLLPDAPDVRQ